MTSATQPPPERPSPERPSIGDLLAQEDFVRRLARKLLGDPHAAEDLVQETWVRALQSPPRHSASLRGWLARVVRNLAANAHTAVGRRPKTTELVDAYALSPSAADSMALGMLRGDLASALGRLSEEQRDVILRRHFDELPPREIARMARVPVETVRTRYKRGMASLRERLDREYGEPGSAWMLGLVGGIRMPLPVPPGAPASQAPRTSPGPGASSAGAGTSLAGRSVLGSASRIAALVGIPLAAATAVWWIVVLPSGDAPDALTGSVEGPVVEVAALAGSVSSARAEAAGARPIVRPARLAVTVRERGSNDPLAGLAVEVESLSLPDEPLEVVVTDRRGQASVAKLLPGTYRIRPERGASIARTLRDGEKAEVDILVPPTRSLRGRVVDANEAPVAGAEVLASLPNEPGRCRVVARSDAGGLFSLSATDPNVWLCAQAPGLADTEMLYLADPVHRNEEREMTLQFRFLPARLDGEVVDERGRPIEGARVYVARGYSQWSKTGIDGGSWPEVRLDGTLAINAPPREIATGKDGGFTIENLRQGNHTLSVAAKGYAPWQLDVMLDPAQPAAIEVALAPGAVLEGSLKTPAGHAAEDATVAVKSLVPDVTRIATTDRRGRFRLEDLPAGEVAVSAWLVADGEPTHASITLDLEAGETAKWEPLLTPGGAVQGVAVDRAGKPLAGWIVAIEREDGIGPHGAKTLVVPRAAVLEVSTDEKGRFTLPGCDAGFYLVTLFAPDDERRMPRVWRSGVVPDTEPIRLAVGAQPTGSVHGRLVAVDDIPIAKVEVMVDTLLLPQQVRAPVQDDGRFAIEGLPPGQFTLRVWGDGVPLQLAAGGKLAGGETMDLGDVGLERTSTIDLAVRRPDGSAPESMQIKLLVESSKPMFASKESPLAGFTFGEPGEVRIGPLPRGRYGLRARTDDGEFTILKRIALHPGKTRTVQLELQPALPREFIFHCPARPKHRGYLVVSILDDDGETIDQRLLHYSGDSEKSTRMAFNLPPGKYGLAARIDGQELAKFDFEHASETGEATEVDLR